jgi:hypothetical protein
MRAHYLSSIVLIAGALHGPIAVADDPISTQPASNGNGQPEPDAVSPDSICQAVAAAAVANDLPVEYFTRLIWQESRFNPNAVSRAGALGVAQFMPATAKWRGLMDPFDPLASIAKSAEHLRNLNREFGNLGFAAAAYNTGAGRVREWLIGRRTLPGETQAYVRIVTGRSVAEWAAGQKGPSEVPNSDGAPCTQGASASVQPPPDAVPSKAEPPVSPWGVELAGGPTPAMALAKYQELKLKYSAGSLLAGTELHLVIRGRIGETAAVRVRIGAETRAAGAKLCSALSAIGWFCEVLRN